MKLIIEIPEQIKQAFDKAQSNDLKGGYYDHGGIIGKAIQNGIPLDDVKAEIKSWYWQVEKQALAKDPCVVDAMVDLFIRTIDNIGKAESVSEKEKRNREVITDIVRDR